MRKDSDKTIEIAEELCYNNISVIGLNGKRFFIYRLVKNFGLIIGFSIFILIFTLFNDRVFNIKYTGSGSMYYYKVDEILKENGIKKFTKFSSIDKKKLANLILEKSQRLSFVSCDKVGNTLSIELVLASDNKKTLKKDTFALYSTCDGVISELKVYSGTAQVSVGDKVKKGDLLVDGYYTYSDNKVKTPVLAFIKIKTTKVFTFESEEEDKKEFAETLAKEQCADNEIISVKTEIKNKEGLFIYKTAVYYNLAITVF